MSTTVMATPDVVWLPATGSDLDAELGGKGCGLDRLLKAGLPVPPSAVVTAAAYRRFAAHPSIRAVIELARRQAVPKAEVDAAFLSAPLEDVLATRIIAAAADIGRRRRIAVRSSAYAEDMAGLSFAGQYHSALNISSDEPQAVLRAVRLTWASLWHPAPSAYRDTWGVPADRAVMSVVLMQMVSARLAGVTFTLDPATGSPQIRVEAVTGLADALVSGERTPTVWLLPRDPAAPVPHDPAAPLAELADLGRRTEQSLGGPQDIEWAWDGEQVWLVQSRPITTLASGDGSDSAINTAELMSTGVDEMLPGVLPPLVWDLNCFLVEEALRRVFDDIAANPTDRSSPGSVVRRARGRAALDLDLLKAVAAGLPGMSEHDLEHAYFGTPVEDDGEPPARRWSLSRDLRIYAARQRSAAEAETVLVAVDQLVRTRPSITVLDDRSLLAYRLRLLDLGARAVAAELAVAAAAAASYQGLERFLARYLDDEEARQATQQLTAGAGLTLPVSDLSSRSVFAGPTWHESGIPALGHDDEAWPDRTVDRRGAQAAIESRLRRHPRWRRLRLLTGQVIDIQLRALRTGVTDAATGLVRRERTKAAVLAIGGCVRQVHIELGRRLHDRGLLQDGAEVDLLRDSELRAAVAGHPPPRGTLSLRRRWQERYEAAGPLPQRFTGVPPVDLPPAPAGRVLSGWAASGGQHTGRARVLDEPLANRLGRGDVLVARATDAAWTPAFLAAGAIVVERGGPLSHAAVVARELGLPAVLNVAGAAAHLDGKLVTVDGDRGQVVVHDDGGGVP